MCASYFNFLYSFVIYWKLPEIFGFHYEVTTHGAPFFSWFQARLLIVLVMYLWIQYWVYWATFDFSGISSTIVIWYTGKVTMHVLVQLGYKVATYIFCICQLLDDFWFWDICVLPVSFSCFSMNYGYCQMLLTIMLVLVIH